MESRNCSAFRSRTNLKMKAACCEAEIYFSRVKGHDDEGCGDRVTEWISAGQ